MAVLLATLLLLLFFLLGTAATRPLWRENGFVENISALSYLTGLLLCGYFAFRFPHPHRLFLIMWAVLCLVFFGEETSWLQHQIGFVTPDWIAARNAQREFNIHNLTPLQGGALLDGDFHWRVLLKSQHLFQAGFVGYFLLLPVLSVLPPTGRWIARLQVPYPGWNLMLGIWAAVAISVVLTVMSNEETRSAIAETREMIYALSILAFLGAYVSQLSVIASRHTGIFKDARWAAGDSRSGRRPAIRYPKLWHRTRNPD